MYALPIDQRGLAGFIPVIERQQSGSTDVPGVDVDVSPIIWGGSTNIGDIASNIATNLGYGPQGLQPGYGTVGHLGSPVIGYIGGPDVIPEGPSARALEAAGVPGIGGSAGILGALIDHPEDVDIVFSPFARPGEEPEGYWSGVGSRAWDKAKEHFSWQNLTSKAAGNLIARGAKVPGLAAPASLAVRAAIEPGSVTMEDFGWALGMVFAPQFFVPAAIAKGAYDLFAGDEGPEAISGPGGLGSLPGFGADPAMGGLGLGASVDVFADLTGFPEGSFMLTGYDDYADFGQMPEAYQMSEDYHIPQVMTDFDYMPQFSPVPTGPITGTEGLDQAFISEAFGDPDQGKGLTSIPSGNTYFVGHDQGLYDWTMDPFDMNEAQWSAFMTDESGFVPSHDYDSDYGDFVTAGDFGPDPDDPSGIYGGEGN